MNGKFTAVLVPLTETYEVTREELWATGEMLDNWFIALVVEQPANCTLPTLPKQKSLYLLAESSVDFSSPFRFNCFNRQNSPLQPP